MAPDIQAPPARRFALPLTLGFAVAFAGVSVPAARALADLLAPAPSAAPAAVVVPEPAPPSPPPPEYAFDAPLPGRDIASPFGLRQLPWEEGGRLHEGVDIAAPSGTAVKVAADGVVIRIGTDPGYGRFVEIRHKDGFSSLYAHLGRNLGMKKGVFVRRGTPIALVGDSGRSTGSHLHFEISRKGRPLNPALFMDKTFASADDLPLKAAARVPRKVRLAHVSRWPEGMKEKVAARRAAANGGVGVAARGEDGRVRVRIAVADG
ncbi:M23 family metallopeptidase [Caulobacter hibisci]|uniref:M23 family metallopeptidase n=1 Tax=Caulobacter hibisci TaxID=2035993 RepID=A0ABS0T128_9CAUL|nr:M23 family metallopeptidase [Caulobacter hibisci]MBI1684628.1 M23 family metallopeptidase [Caulobacter hibisci]